MPPLCAHRARPHIARLGDLDDIAAHPFGGWPPPGTHVGPDGWNTVEPAYDIFGAGAGDGLLSLEVIADEGCLPTTGFWWTTIGELLLPLPNWAERFGARILQLWLELDFNPALNLAAIPVVWRAGEDLIMRWLQSTVRGTLGATVEEFQFKIDWGNPGDDPDYTDAQQLAMASTLAGLWATFWTNTTTEWPGGTNLREVGVSQHEQTVASDKNGNGGNLTSGMTNWHLFTTQPAGTSTSASLPFEVACAISTHTAHRGPSGRGRFYLPPFADSGCLSVTNPGTFDPTFLGLVTVELAELFDNARAALDPLVPVMVSRRRLILNEITSLTVGHVPDSQRRRRRSQIEAPSVFWTA